MNFMDRVRRLCEVTQVDEQFVLNLYNGALTGHAENDQSLADVWAASRCYVDVMGSPVLSVWARGFLDGHDLPSTQVVSHSVPIHGLQGELAARITRIFQQSSTILELIAPARSVAPAHAAGAMTRLNAVPLFLDLRAVPERAIHDIVLPEAAEQARILGMGLILLVEPGLLDTPELYATLQDYRCLTVVVTHKKSRTYTPRPQFASLEVAQTPASDRHEMWAAILSGAATDEVAMRELARVPLGAPQMFEAFVLASTRAVAAGTDLTITAVQTAASQLAVQDSSRRVDVRADAKQFTDLSFGRALARELENLVAASAAMYDRPVANRTGLKVLFSGPSGTGKTAVAEAIGRELGRPVLVADLSRIVDKYIGETEKNLDYVMSLADDVDGILLFDEGESLFGKRDMDSSSSNSHFSNMQTSYLLARIERHRGMVVLCSNYPGALDAAFVRRFHLQLTFAMPAPDEREALWHTLLKRHGLFSCDDTTPFAAYDLSPGNIDAICYLASLLSTHQDDDLAPLIRRLVEQEYARLGKRLTKA